MEKVKKIIRTIMFETYVKEDRVLTFQEVQNILISKGFSYYETKEGIKKLRILRKIRPTYRGIKRSLPKMKQNRDFAMSMLEEAVISYRKREISLKVLDRLVSTLSEFLTREDIERIKRLRNEGLPKKFSVRF